MSESARIASAVAEAVKLMDVLPSTVDDMLGAIVDAAVGAVPGFDHVGISVTHRDGEIETRAGTDQLVWDLDQIQYELGEGPCYDAIRGNTVTVVNHARHDQRWPRYMPLAAERGLRSQLGVGLYRSTDTLGGLNLYSTQSDTVSEDAILIAELFASHAAIVLGESRSVGQLNEAIASRTTIGQAVGILMERYGMDDDRAFQFLIRVSQTSNTKLRVVAEEIVSTTIQRLTES